MGCLDCNDTKRVNDAGHWVPCLACNPASVEESAAFAEPQEHAQVEAEVQSGNATGS